MCDNKMFAFWDYDSYPFLLGSPVSKMVEKGCVKLEGYGGMMVRPSLLLPLEEGKALNKKLEHLARQHRIKMEELRKESYEEVKSLLYRPYSVKCCKTIGE